MDIRWLADTSFTIIAETGTVITNPPPGIRPGPELGAPPSVITLSHEGARHDGIALWTGAGHLLDGPGEYEITGLGVRGVATMLSSADEPGALNTVFVVEAEGLAVCHLGAVAEPLTAQAIRLIGGVDVLLAPAGGADQPLGADQAAAIVRSIEPRMVIPMHPGVAPGSTDLSPLDPFISELGAQRPDPAPRASLTRSNVGDGLRLVLLRPIGG